MSPQTWKGDHAPFRPSLKEVSRRPLVKVQSETKILTQSQQLPDEVQGIVLSTGAPGGSSPAGVNADEHLLLPIHLDPSAGWTARTYLHRRLGQRFHRFLPFLQARDEL